MSTATKTGKAGLGAIVTAFCLLSLVPYLVGCKQYEPQSNVRMAAAYYRQKYGDKIGVSEHHNLGTYALFGYSYSGTEYVMEDGVSVIYVDDEGVFKDNRQAQQIENDVTAFAQEQLGAIPGALTPIEIDSVGQDVYFETYEGEGACWHAYYDGDVRLKELDGGLWECVLSGEVAEAKANGDDVYFYIQNNTASSLVTVSGIDKFSTLCAAHESVSHASLRDGQRIFIGDEEDIWPCVSILV